MAHLKAWAEHIWTRIRRMDYWNPDHIATNTAARAYRWVAPGAQPPAVVQTRHPENVFSIRYFQRDQIRRDTHFYPDTPLSLNHNLMKGKPLRPSDAPPATLPKVTYDGFFANRARS